MNIFDEDDRRIEAIFKADIYEPDSYTQAIMTAFSNNKKKTIFNIPRLIAAIIAGIMVVSSIAYAEQIEKFILKFFNNNRGLDTAVENGYIDSINATFDSNTNTNVELKYYIIDDNNMNFVINVEIDNSLNIEDVSKVSIPDIIITDDNKNILYCRDNIKFEEYCLKNNLNISYLVFSDNYNNCNINWAKDFSNSDKKSIEIGYNLSSTGKLPNSKKIFIEFNHIKISLEENDDIILEGSWKVEFDVTKKFYNRESLNYKMIENSNLNIVVNRLNVYNTSTFLEIESNVKPLYTDDMTEETKDQKEKDFIKSKMEGNPKNVENAYIENSNGKRFSKIESSSTDSVIKYNADGSFYYKDSFTLTQYDATDTLTVHFTLNTIDGSEDVVIKLERDN